MIFPYVSDNNSLLSSVVFSVMLCMSLSVVLSSSFLHADAHSDFCDAVSMTASAALAQDRFHVSQNTSLFCCFFCAVFVLAFFVLFFCSLFLAGVCLLARFCLFVWEEVVGCGSWRGKDSLRDRNEGF